MKYLSPILMLNSLPLTTGEASNSNPAFSVIYLICVIQELLWLLDLIWAKLFSYLSLLVLSST